MLAAGPAIGCARVPGWSLYVSPCYVNYFTNERDTCLFEDSAGWQAFQRGCPVYREAGRGTTAGSSR